MLIAKIVLMSASLLVLIGCNTISDTKISEIASQHNQDKILQIIKDESARRGGSGLSPDRYQFYLKLSNQCNLDEVKEKIELKAIDHFDNNAIAALILSGNKPSNIDIAIKALDHPATCEYGLRFNQNEIYPYIIKNIINEIDNNQYSPNSIYMNILQLKLKSKYLNKYETLGNLILKYDIICKELDPIDAQINELDSKANTLNKERNAKINDLEQEYQEICLKEMNSQSFASLRPECQNFIRIMFKGLARNGNLANLNDRPLPADISFAEERKFRIYFQMEELRNRSIGSSSNGLQAKRDVLILNKNNVLKQLKNLINGFSKLDILQ